MEQGQTELYKQTRARVEHYLQDAQGNIPDPEYLVIKVSNLVDKNRKRFQKGAVLNPNTGVPDAYIDDVVKYYIQEAPRVAALSAGDAQAWDKVLMILSTRVRNKLWRSCVKGSFLLDHADDFVQYTAEIAFSSLNNYYRTYAKQQ